MAWVPIIPIINNGNGWGSNYVPREEMPCYAFYMRKDGNTRYKIKFYVDKLREVLPTVTVDNNVFYIYAIQQDDILERVEYNANTGRYAFTGEIG